MKFDAIAEPKMMKRTLLEIFEKNWYKQKNEIQKLGLDDKTIDRFEANN